MAARRLPKTTKNDQKPTKNRLPTQKRGPEYWVLAAPDAFRKTLKRGLWPGLPPLTSGTTPTPGVILSVLKVREI